MIKFTIHSIPFSYDGVNIITFISQYEGIKIISSCSHKLHPVIPLVEKCKTKLLKIIQHLLIRINLGGFSTNICFVNLGLFPRYLSRGSTKLIKVLCVDQKAFVDVIYALTRGLSPKIP